MTPGRMESASGARSDGYRYRWAGFVLVAAVALILTFLYGTTFRGSLVSRQTHGPFNFECGVYHDFARGKIDPAVTDNNKLAKHLLCAVGYPLIYRLARTFPSLRDSPFVCSFLTGLMLLLFGLWLYRRTGYRPVTFPVLLLLGLSFTTWYVGSVWESRSFIALGAVILLITLDRLIRSPSPLALTFAVLALTFSLLITVGNAYLLPLLPAALLLSSRRLGLARALRWSVLALSAVILLVSLVYGAGSLWLNPNLSLSRLLEIAAHEQEQISASLNRLNGENYLKVFTQALIYSVGGIRLIPSNFMETYEGIWSSPDFLRLYLWHFNSALFVFAYAVILLALPVVVIAKNLFCREPLLLLIGVWILCYVSFFVYFNPTAGPVYAAEVQPLLWAAVGLAGSRLRPRWTVPFLFFCAILVGWNNLSVIRLFRNYYDDNRRDLLTRDTYPTQGRYDLWIWEVKSELVPGTRVRIEAAHPLPGRAGGFRIVAWTDADGDGFPDREVARSGFLASPSPGGWSSFEFVTATAKIYVGYTWPGEGFMLVYRRNDFWPAGHNTLDDYFYYRQSGSKLRRAGPAFTNMKVTLIPGE